MLFSEIINDATFVHRNFENVFVDFFDHCCNIHLCCFAPLYVYCNVLQSCSSCSGMHVDECIHPHALQHLGQCLHCLYRFVEAVWSTGEPTLSDLWLLCFPEKPDCNNLGQALGRGRQGSMLSAGMTAFSMYECLAAYHIARIMYIIYTMMDMLSHAQQMCISLDMQHAQFCCKHWLLYASARAQVCPLSAYAINGPTYHACISYVVHHSLYLYTVHHTLHLHIVCPTLCTTTAHCIPLTAWSTYTACGALTVYCMIHHHCY